MSERLLQAIKDCGALKDGHFIGASGKHLTGYLDKATIRRFPFLVREIAKTIADHFTIKGIEIVVAPAIGAISFGDAVALQLAQRLYDLGNENGGADLCSCTYGFPQSLIAEKEDGDFVLKRGYDEAVKDRRVLVVEDITTSGGSLKKTCLEVERHGGQIIGAAVIMNRGGPQAGQLFADYDFFTVIDPQIVPDMPNYTLEECRASGPCSRRELINTRFGHGAEFVAEHGQPT